MIWTYLANSQSVSISSLLIQNPLTFECIDFEPSNKELLDKLIDGYIKLIDEGFFEGFINDYNILFISSHGPTESSITREKLFDIKLNMKMKIT
jgi:hypothetical protein